MENQGKWNILNILSLHFFNLIDIQLLSKEVNCSREMALLGDYDGAIEKSSKFSVQCITTHNDMKTSLVFTHNRFKDTLPKRQAVLRKATIRLTVTFPRHLKCMHRLLFARELGSVQEGAKVRISHGCPDAPHPSLAGR